MESNADIEGCKLINNQQAALSGLDHLDQEVSSIRSILGLFKLNAHPPILVRKLVLKSYCRDASFLKTDK